MDGETKRIRKIIAGHKKMMREERAKKEREVIKGEQTKLI